MGFCRPAALAGIGFGGAYMPGLKALTDRLPPGDTSRSVTLYTASFSVGVGLSFDACAHGELCAIYDQIESDRVNQVTTIPKKADEQGSGSTEPFPIRRTR
jgi:hypothetical protein